MNQSQLMLWRSNWPEEQKLRTKGLYGSSLDRHNAPRMHALNTTTLWPDQAWHTHVSPVRVGVWLTRRCCSAVSHCGASSTSVCRKPSYVITSAQNRYAVKACAFGYKELSWESRERSSSKD